MPESAPPQEPTVVRMPIVRLVSDGARVVMQVVGSTTTPPGAYNDRYIGVDGYVDTPAEAVNVRGPEGPSENNTTVIEGSPGTPGKSAYTLWLEAGNSGSMATFLASLKGQQGDPGVQGIKGEKGDKGDSGLRGDPGPVGATGPAGATGEKGDPGATGAPGAAGAAGPKGDLGATGAVGPAGAKGDTGAAGAQGPQGLKGDTGAQGVKGDAGPAGEIFLRQINVTDTASIAITLGVVDKQYACAGAVVGERYMAFVRTYKLNGAATATPGRPDGYYIVAVDCRVADTVNIVHMRPAIAVLGKYELFTDIVKVNAS